MLRSIIQYGSSEALQFDHSYISSLLRNTYFVFLSFFPQFSISITFIRCLLELMGRFFICLKLLLIKNHIFNYQKLPSLTVPFLR